ncbi:LysR family transcriptional regulator [Nocardia asteroides]|uniref:LysR family transcriptional regulator n=1 Tax=Nocardia asteroides NBRC 15531 TaxID=1110697 RepID=U5EGP2_NOCAS|nr:LysR substrate-binding domain-containing protein [Nocardia asteroides]TLF67631.1 LysR family transcriptional regulator [Nocardia asteroides NBRC 15531]UGT50865.1 LysR substrate-binding domain-containing protein [Nocardia asteroides]SFN46631.1 DNA-binding transcriptional regulator, LysR family [Nocardia asteroides]VEG36283.1 Hca operon transcriptional activator [Nocardia asteroides]GAD85553.1 putative LysR family transcriptional regulator [Nocardia asteroides NBRC 15531]
MEFRHLVSFITIAEELHFGRAAQRLHLTQPSLSAQLQKLEKSLGVQLVARNSHEVRLTPAGREFELQARQIVAQLDRAAQAAKATAEGRAGSLNVGYNLPASRHVLPEALTRMTERHPDIVVSLWEKRTGPQLAALADGSLDLALVYGHPSTADFRYRRLLHRVPLVAVVGRRHRWADRPGVPFAELQSQDCVLFAREQCPAMYDTILRSAAETRISLNVTHSADDPGATAHMVSVRPLVGFASLPRAISMGMGVPGSSSVAVKLFDPVPTLDLHAVWRADEQNPAVSLFLECIESAQVDDVRALSA